MGYVQAVSGCAACGKPFSYSITKVPSVVVNGSREPICRECVERANPIREERGLARIEILPGAYEADDENEVPWGDD
jgi:hypothetical protein